MKKRLTLILVLISACVLGVGAYYWNLLQKIKSTDPAVWERSIEQFEASDRESGFRENSLVFVGSSSVAQYDGLEQLMAPNPILRRGFGGASVSDIRHYRQRLVDTYQPRIIVIYVGAIDVYYHYPNKPEKVVVQLNELFAETLENNPGAEVYYVAIRPSPFDPERWGDIDYVNNATLHISEATERLNYVDANDSVKDSHGVLRKDVYKIDKMHLNDEGNQAWWSALKQGMGEASEH